MKRYLACATLIFALIPTLVAAQQTNQWSSVPSNSAPASVAGTTWVGTDSDGDYTEYHFQADGTLHYKSPTGFYKNGSWRQDGNKIYMETNKKFSEYQGLISGTRMEGNAWSIKGQKWAWVADKK